MPSRGAVGRATLHIRRSRGLPLQGDVACAWGCTKPVVENVVLAAGMPNTITGGFYLACALVGAGSKLVARQAGNSPGCGGKGVTWNINSEATRRMRVKPYMFA